ncbi:hypothetical protein IQ254_20495 [Nodosilinea sp. LEGE 07088]|uniref:hypothetical protein n=1 Tax=Nodosilinea sp. LEGE 07088 TaxID=2777968 RepID=UPI00187E734A|nr:hypothetical protein [Nodosilinea sp. LEGE 07088]MBE9139547.1 hypothetical protein [Nodosilinea sp. LEGE 07088]
MVLPLGTHTLDLATGQPPRLSFRQGWTLDLPSGYGTLQVAPGAQIQAEFLALTFNALASGAVVAASCSSQGGGVRVELALPLRLYRVVAASGVTGIITVHRVDGSAIAEQATATVGSGGLLAQEFTDRQFVLKRAGGNLAPAQIAQLWFTSYPTTPRFGLVDETDSLISLWQAPGQLITSSAQSKLTLANEDFQPLERFLAGPSTSTLKLVAESDAPCRLQLTHASLGYRRRYQGFAPQAAALTKQVLRFQGHDLRPQAVALTLPPQVQAASLQLSVSLKGSQSSRAPSAIATLAPPSQRQGVELWPQQWAGLPLTPALATRYSGVTLGLLLLRSPTTLTVDLHTDADGLPGPVLAQVSQTIQAATQPQWITLGFPAPVVLYRQPYWLLVSASDPALWLTQPGAGELYLLESSSQTLWHTRHHYPNTQALYQGLEPAAPAPDGSPTGAGGHPALSLQIANVALPHRWHPERDRIEVDLMAGGPAHQAGAAVALTIATASSGIVTVYAPSIEYRPPAEPS